MRCPTTGLNIGLDLHLISALVYPWISFDAAGVQGLGKPNPTIAVQKDIEPTEKI
jgi:hypothetical protein